MESNKLLLIQLLLICNISLFAQAWVPLDGSKNTQKPSIGIVTSNSQELVFTVKVFGFLSQKESIDNVIYDVLYLYIPIAFLNNHYNEMSYSMQDIIQVIVKLVMCIEFNV